MSEGHIMLACSVKKVTFIMAVYYICVVCDMNGTMGSVACQVNILGVCVCTREFVKQLKERKVDDGHIFLLNRYIDQLA